MALVQWIRNHPLALAGVLVAAFGVWLAADATREETPQPPFQPPEVFTTSRALPADPTKTQRTRDLLRPGVVTADLIPRLHPGMARVEVEELIGPPPAGLVQPVANVDGKLIYRASYFANLDAKPDAPSGSATPAPTPRSVIAIEFDASRPGHPLLKVHLPDPMS
jgi:hypothetical protein